jgi:beta-fructofuranosidase
VERSQTRAGSDPHFPIAHVRPLTGFVGDPNGPIWHRGRYHIFFQHNPATVPRQKDVVWGHGSSPDLAGWTMHGVALSHSDEHAGVDEFWSGNTVEKDGRLFAFYSARRASDRYELPRMVVSDDAGASFAGDRPTVPLSDLQDGLEIFRDPYVWRHEHGWRMLIGSGLGDGTACVFLFESEDLLAWTPSGEFAELRSVPAHDGDLGSCWECPQYAWEPGILIIAAWRPETGPLAVYALKGSERDGRFSIRDIERVDHGPDFYAPSLMRNDDGRWLLWGWLWEARDREWRDEVGWSGMLSLPRELTLEDDRLVVRPARELEALRDDLCRAHSGSGDARLGEVPRAFELWLRLEGPASQAAIILECGEGQTFEIQLDGVNGRVTVDRDHASADARAYRGSSTIESKYGLLERGVTELRWFVDRSVSELFLSEGAVATTRFFPVSDAPWKLRITAPADVAVEARVWQLLPSIVQPTGTPR